MVYWKDLLYWVWIDYHDRGLDSFDSDEEFRKVLVTALQERIQQIVRYSDDLDGSCSSDNPTTNNVAVMIVHESFISQYKKDLDNENKAIIELKKQLETGNGI